MKSGSTRIWKKTWKKFWMLLFWAVHARNTANIKNRQPIGTMYVKAPRVMDKYFTDIIADELNVKEVKFADDVESFISYSFKPQLRTVGPKYGKLLGGIRAALAEINGSKAMNDLKANGVLVLDIDGNKVELTEEDLLIETAQTEGYVTESEGETAVVLDTNLTPELIEEGFVREIISKVQTMRKEAGFEVMDKIRVSVKDNDKIIETMKANEAEIKSEVLAEEVVYGETDGYVKEWNINKEHVTLGVDKALDLTYNRRIKMIDKQFDKETFKKSVKDNVKFLYRRKLEEATQEQIFQAVSYTVKDVIIDNWLDTQNAL